MIWAHKLCAGSNKKKSKEYNCGNRQELAKKVHQICYELLCTRIIIVDKDCDSQDSKQLERSQSAI